MLPDDCVTSMRLKVERSDSDDAVLPDDGVTTKRVKVERIFGFFKSHTVA